MSIAKKRNQFRLVRSRTTGMAMIGVMVFLILGLFFGVNEPTVVALTKDIDIPICPPFCDEAYLTIPIPEFEKRVIELTPIVTTTDDLGNKVTTRGETTFLQQITGFTLIVKGDTSKTFDNGRLKIELELVTDLKTDEEIKVIGALESVESTEEGSNTGTTPFTNMGFTTNGEFIAEILDIGINQLVPVARGIYHYDFVITTIVVDFDELKFSNELPITIYTLDMGNVDLPEQGLPSPLPEPAFCDAIILNQTGVCATPTLSIPDLVPCGNCDILLIQQEIPEIPEEAIVEEVIEDIPNMPCFETTFDSISFLYPTTAVSGTTAFWGTSPEGLDQNNVDVRNNRNCDLDIALGSRWISTTGQIYSSGLMDIKIATNATIPFKSIPFDADAGCGGGSCAGLKVQLCFVGQVSTTDPVEVIAPYCGNKFFR